MRILFFTEVYPDEHGFLGGLFIHNQAVALKNSGHEVAVMFVDFRSIKHRREFAFSKYELDTIPVFRYSFPVGPIYFLIDAVGSQLAERLYQKTERIFGEADLIYVHFGGCMKHIISTCKRHDKPYVITEHGSDVLTGELSEKEIAERREGYNHASAVIAVSEALKRKLCQITEKEITVIPNIIPDYMFDGDLNNKEQKDEYYRYISVGNLIKSKAFDITIKAFAEIAKKNPKSKLIIVGDGAEEKELKNLVQALEIDNIVEFRGRMENKALAMLLRGCDCFVLPSKFETFGVVYIEAMASGLPVIATKCGGPEEFVNESNGILIDLDDVDGLKQAMEKIRNGMYNSKFLRDQVWKMYSANAVVEKITGVFRNI